MYPFVAIPERDGSGWSIQFPDLPGATGFAETIDQIGEEARIVSELWLEGREESGRDLPEPTLDWDPIHRAPEDFNVDHVYTTQEVAELLGVSPRRVNALSTDRGVGTRIGKIKVFTKGDVRKLRQRRPGRPRIAARAATLRATR
jgi:predicted RNase H-like HicB family nuclease